MGGNARSPDTSVPRDPLTVTVHWEKAQQPIRGFGASGAWSTQFVGTDDWSVRKRNQIADWLFSTETDAEGRPTGIGLSIWRFNIGAGSAEQGEASGIQSEWRRAEGFLQKNGTYDWSRQAGQRWFLRAADERDVPTIIGFSNSPPVELTRNGRAFGDGGGTANLSDDRMDDFASFLATVAAHFADAGTPFDYLSPVNEPQWNWSRDDNQEGSPYTNAEHRRLVEMLDDTLSARGLSTRIEIPETAQIDYLYKSGTDRPARDDQIAYFFGEHELQRRSHVAPTVVAHSYFTTWPVDELIEKRERVAEQIQSVDPTLEYGMSEYCILADNEEIEGPGRDLGMDPALYVARVLHADLTVAQASSWQWWLGISPGDFKDGLVYVDRDTKAIHDSKFLWGLGNYSRFVRPGAVRVAVSRSDDTSRLDRMKSGLLVSAYRAADAPRPVVVAVNQSGNERGLQVRTDALPDTAAVETWRPYVTSSAYDLAPQPAVAADQTLTIPARSIVTIVAGS